MNLGNSPYFLAHATKALNEAWVGKKNDKDEILSEKTETKTRETYSISSL